MLLTQFLIQHNFTILWGQRLFNMETNVQFMKISETFSRGYLIHSAQFVRIQIPVVVKQFLNSFILSVYNMMDHPWWYSIFSGLNSLPLITTNRVCTIQVVSVNRQSSAILIRSVKMKTFQNAGKSIIWQQAVISILRWKTFLIFIKSRNQ